MRPSSVSAVATSPTREVLPRVRAALAQCSRQALAYGRCVRAASAAGGGGGGGAAVERGACERRFAALKGCFRQALRNRGG